MSSKYSRVHCNNHNLHVYCYIAIYSKVCLVLIYGCLFVCLFVGDLKSGGFCLDACRSMVALMDVSCCNACFINYYWYN